MALFKQTITQKSKNFMQLNQLLQQGFGPFVKAEDLAASASKPNNYYYAYYDNKQLIGSIFVHKDPKYIYFGFLTVGKQFRNKSYGSQIIKLLKKENHNKPLYVCVERLKGLHLNNKQRHLRVAFYERLGFIYTDITMKHKLGKLNIMTTDHNANLEQMEQNIYQIWKDM